MDATSSSGVYRSTIWFAFRPAGCKSFFTDDHSRAEHLKVIQEHSKARRRHLHMTKSQTRFFTIVGFLILFLGISFFIYSKQSKGLDQVFQGIVHRDCAPWDGGAFTVQ